MNEIIDHEKDISDDIFPNYFKYHSPSFLAKDLKRAEQAKNEKSVNNITDELIDLRNATTEKEIP